ncbi:MAG: hypothetical protein A3E83_08835 [Gammaproteobacteria bacterium RIFCSPHIGHO2_12_FULL_41_20]|nr:MAG: hypothetical protein A3E83_08835 [Gammaproteobacteria bacterium RIFCSPHIGHO2_12_FULL_41_20]
MRKCLFWGLILLSGFWLSGCVNTHKEFSLQIQHDLLTETWPNNINIHPERWTRHADSWFLAAEPNQAERANRHSPFSRAISTMEVKVPNFSAIRVDGTFTVQLFGGVDHNSVFVYGPNAEVRKVAVDMRNGTLCVYQIPGSAGYLRHTIIRIGVHNLKSLTNLGPGLVEGRQLSSSGLQVYSRGSGDILLSGNLLLRRVVSSDSGDIIILGIASPAVTIKMYGSGDVNLSGRVGVRSIYHAGWGNLNIIGADSSSLYINACNSAMITIVGCVNLRVVEASNDARIYLYSVRSQRLRVSTHDHACVGLAGYAHILHVDTHGASGFDGQYLSANTVYARAYDTSHANVSATNKAFAMAVQNSSIYFFGSSSVLSKYQTDNGSIMTLSRTRRFAPPSLCQGLC